MDVHEMSVAEARRRLAEVLDTVEGGDQVRITRRGRGVARVVSEQDYDVLVRGRPDIWVAIDGFRRDHRDDLPDDGWAADLRSSEAGRPGPFDD
ncbi:MAG: type II toxin-antitoxin system Phd/YefM family antitoxin [Euzebya sp.]